ncbi:MAG: alpha/beta hydrolase [Pseudoruegeria sp.]
MTSVWFEHIMRSGFLFFAALVLTSCAGPKVLVDTPNIYSEQTPYPAEAVPAANRRSSAEILYVTDRVRDKDAFYGADRSKSMVAGTASVQLGAHVSWDELALASSQNPRSKSLRMTISQTKEQVSFPATPLPFDLKNNQPVVKAGPQRDYRSASDQFKTLVRGRLRQSGSGDVLLLVHGVSTDFETGVFSLADVWHFTGRRSVPILYSWPSGRGGLFGYFTDRESGEFTIFHLKETLRILRGMPEVKRINIIAHSRGTDVTTSALRELVIEARASGQNPRQVLKVENLIMAAPDLDFGVVGQRLIAEQFGPAIGRITIYTNQGDNALGLSQRLMAGVRVGRLDDGEVDAAEAEIFQNVRNVHFIDVKGSSDILGHTYYRDNPAALSDIALLLETSAQPGSQTRPLQFVRDNFWELPIEYPN